MAYNSVEMEKRIRNLRDDKLIEMIQYKSDEFVDDDITVGDIKIASARHSGGKYNAMFAACDY